MRRVERQVQSAAELDEHYAEEDPWSYDDTPDDRQRVARVLAALPRRAFPRTLDVGCGNGFLSLALPGDELVGVDVSERAVAWARQRARRTAPDRDVRFEARSLFACTPEDLGTFDLVVVTGVVYPQYVGRAHATVTQVLRGLLRPGAVLVTVHIDAWTTYRAPFTSLSTSVDRYRDHFHRLEVFQA